MFVFSILKVLLTIAIMWGLCAIFTVTNVFPPGHPARTDVRLSVLEDASWFYVPYPGQFGIPSVTLSGKYEDVCMSPVHFFVKYSASAQYVNFSQIFFPMRLCIFIAPNAVQVIVKHIEIMNSFLLPLY